MRTTTLVVLLPILLGSSHATSQGNLELGKMWTFENPPLAYLEREYAFVPTQEWLDALRLASLRFGSGCSASFVSPRGLIMTNHHCIRDYIAQVSPKEADWVQNGFVARELGDEVKIPGLTVQQLVSMRDVTAAINAGVAEGDADAEINRKRAENEQRLLKAARAESSDLTPQVIKLHQGAVFQLYFYRIYNDIRLVCAPHLQMAHFGGDPDNFTYPRYSIDFSFCRAWDGDQPVDTSKHFFKWSKTGATEGDLVFVTGNPGSTDRLKTVAQMEYLRDASYPMLRQMLDNRIAVLRELSASSPERAQELRTQILMLENGQKAYAGYHAGLEDPQLMAQKRRAELEFKSKVEAAAELRQQFGDVWHRLEEVAAARAKFEPARRFHTPGGSKHLARALETVRAVLGTEAERAEHADEARRMPTTMSAVERAFFVDHLVRSRSWLAADDPWRRAVLGDAEPEAVAASLDSSAIADTTFVDQLIAGGEAAVRAAQDPAVRIAVAIDPLIKAKDQQEERLAQQESVLGVRIGKAMFACYGNDVSPDATFSLRFSDGVVAGFPCNGTIAPWRTSFYGLYGRNVEFADRHPFDLPKIWLERQSSVDMTKSVNFVSSNDIIGGNSGSPIVSKDLQVVGLIFDGNIEMLANRFVYTGAVPRSVSVHVDAIVEALSKIYAAERVVAELSGE